MGDRNRVESRLVGLGGHIDVLATDLPSVVMVTVVSSAFGVSTVVVRGDELHKAIAAATSKKVS